MNVAREAMNMAKGKDVDLSLKTIYLLFLTLLSISIGTELGASQTTTVYVYPSATTVPIGQTFTIDIKISAVSDLYGWEFRLGWDPNLLDVVDVLEGGFLKSGGSTFFDKKMNNTVGYILVDCTLLGMVSGVNGDGTLASVGFYAEKEGTTNLDLYDTILIDSSEQAISHAVVDGSVTVSKSVGGIVIPLSKLELLAPWIGLTSTIAFAMCSIIVFAKRRKRKR